MMQVEIFERKPDEQSKLPPLLFVHGACLGAWCWTDGFLEFFATAGFHAIALNLRGHGGSQTDKPLSKLGIDDYVADVASVAEQVAEPPVIIGHSMGGLIVQRFAAKFPTAGVILMGTSPFAGMYSQAWRLFRMHPWPFFTASLTRDIFRIYPDDASVRKIMFSPHTPAEIVHNCRMRMQKESWRACDEMNPALKEPYPIQSPILVLGGELDQTVLAEAIRETAVAYDAPYHIFSGMGHNLMLEPAWQDVAQFMVKWLRQTVEAFPEK